MAKETTPLLVYSTHGTVSSRKTFGNIIVSIVGSGVLGLPFTFKLNGWAVASIAVLLSATLTYFCMLLLVSCRNKLKDQSPLDILTYGDLGRRLYGEIGKTIVDIAVFISQSGCCVAYLIFIGQNLSSIFTGTTSQQTVFILILVPFQIFLAWVRSLAGLAPFSMLADICNVVAMAVVIKDDVNNFQGFESIRPYRQWKELPFALGVAVYCYEGFGMTLTLEASMKEPHKFRVVLGQSFILITALYIAFGFVGYLAFGDLTLDIITLNLPNDWSTVAVKVGLCIALFFTFPVMMYPVHEMIERSVVISRCYQHNAIHYPRACKLVVNTFRGGTVVIIALVAVYVPGFGFFISLVGSTVCVVLAFVFPALFHLRAFSDSLCFTQKVIDLFLVVAGISFAIYGTYTTCKDAFGKTS
eukprot:c22575_g1_i1 orf=364-1605(+)